ncbi:hypothetical protein, partial [Vibrio sp. 10N.261.49.A11]|uniref:hypothetical protein n=1 Tax=Vibrio sp. 10N.261.49.A11 TaxID=3229666 RepID=UPI00354D6E74
MEDVNHLTSELKPTLEKAIASLDEINVTEEEKDNVFENVLTLYHSEFAKYMVRIQRLELVLIELLKTFGTEQSMIHKASLFELQKAVATLGILSDPIWQG